MPWRARPKRYKARTEEHGPHHSIILKRQTLALIQVFGTVDHPGKCFRESFALDLDGW